MSKPREVILITRLVLDVLKPHQPSVIDFSRELARVPGVRRIDISVLEVDAETETVKLVIDGENIELEKISEAIKNLGGAIHSVDAAVVERVDYRR
ncbi:MAG: DUF211 domain-containing protein [Nitrososphaerota archaeon]